MWLTPRTVGTIYVPMGNGVQFFIQPAKKHCQLGGFEKSKLNQSSTARSVHSKKTDSQLEISKSSFYDLDVLNYEDWFEKNIVSLFIKL